MAGRIVVFGATGYAGDLTARTLVERGARPVLAARNEDRVRALAQELGGLEWAVANVDQPELVRGLVERGDVLVSTVGVPGNLAGALALREAGEAATRVDIGYFAPGASRGTSSLSGGTRASAAGIALEPGFAWHGGRLVDERPARRARSFELSPGRMARAITVAGSEHFGLPRVHPTLRDVDVFLGWFGALSDPLRVLWAGLSMVTEFSGAKSVLEDAFGRLFNGSSGGPDAAVQAKSRSVVLAEAFDAAGTRLAAVRLEGRNIYDLTAGLLAWGAQTAATGGLQGTGAMGPVDGFGLEPLQAGVAEAGLARV
jgi:NAD(P)-dependent dehydrogenase (short-subunit alcohol dehydrogenase family)